MLKKLIYLWWTKYSNGHDEENIKILNKDPTHSSPPSLTLILVLLNPDYRGIFWHLCKFSAWDQVSHSLHPSSGPSLRSLVKEQATLNHPQSSCDAHCISAKLQQLKGQPLYILRFHSPLETPVPGCSGPHRDSALTPETEPTRLDSADTILPEACVLPGAYHFQGDLAPRLYSHYIPSLYHSFWYTACTPPKKLVELTRNSFRLHTEVNKSNPQNKRKKLKVVEEMN